MAIRQHRNRQRSKASVLDLPRQIGLAAGDYFMHGQDRRMRRVGLPGNVCRVAIQLDGGLDPDRLRQRVAASPMLNWLSRVRVIRPLPVFPPLWWASARPPPSVGEHDGKTASHDVPASLPEAVRRRELDAGARSGICLGRGAPAGW